ncbi:hypothetical protein TNCV_3902941 [Trichonephila clavipes]|nr:hypothetical protein TNCV_3902941 [Trichonephila clavipes]
MWEEIKTLTSAYDVKLSQGRASSLYRGPTVITSSNDGIQLLELLSVLLELYLLSRTYEGRQVVSSKPSATEDPLYREADARSICRSLKSACGHGVKGRRVRYHLRCRPRHLIMTRNYEVHHQ